MTNYSTEFRTLAADSGWNSSSLTDAFYNRLSDDIKDELVARDPPTGLDALIVMAIRIDEHLQERRQEKVLTSTPRSLPHSPASPPTSRFSLENMGSPGEGENLEGEAHATWQDQAVGCGAIASPKRDPAGAGFFFVEKDKSLSPCIDYHGLNDVTIKNRHRVTGLPAVGGYTQPILWFPSSIQWTDPTDELGTGDCLESRL